MHGNEQEFILSMTGFLGWFYLAAGALNVGACAHAWRCGNRRREAFAWLAFAAMFMAMGRLDVGGNPPVLSEGIKNAVDGALGPVTFTTGCFAGLVIFYLGRSFFVRREVAWTALNVSLLFMGLSLTDAEFTAIVAKPDNVPIVAMVYLLAFFTWLATARAVENDRRLADGGQPLEKDLSDTVLVWPDVVYIELIGVVIGLTVLIVWSLVLKAPLEQPANPVITPNPSKAPWYFLGLQEMLVFFDPAIAGVTLPCLTVLGLMAIPYLDVNPKGNGYYTIKQRKFAYLVFQFGFLQLWILLILIGTFMRGPNWNFFGLYEPRDPHKILALTNIKLSEYFWTGMLGKAAVPQVPIGIGVFREAVFIAWREIAGIVSLVLYFGLLPPLLGRTLLKNFRQQMGRGRYTIMILLLLMMLTLPLKMILRWTLNLSYIVSIPEYFLNF